VLRARHAARKTWSHEENAAPRRPCNSTGSPQVPRWDVIAAAIQSVPHTAQKSTITSYSHGSHDLPPRSPTIPDRALSRYRLCAGHACAVACHSIPRIASATGSAIRVSGASVKTRSPKPARRGKQRDACGPSAHALRVLIKHNKTEQEGQGQGSPTRLWEPAAASHLF
jgi:hypothetical protein